MSADGQFEPTKAYPEGLNQWEQDRWGAQGATPVPSPAQPEQTPEISPWAPSAPNNFAQPTTPEPVVQPAADAVAIWQPSAIEPVSQPVVPEPSWQPSASEVTSQPSAPEQTWQPAAPTAPVAQPAYSQPESFNPYVAPQPVAPQQQPYGAAPQGYPTQQPYAQQPYASQPGVVAPYTGQPGMGYPQMGMVDAYAPYGYDPITGRPFSDKSKTTAGLLQILLSGLAAGRFYKGDTGIAIAQILVNIFTFGFGVIWPIIDGIVMLSGNPTDSQGRPLRS